MKINISKKMLKCEVFAVTSNFFMMFFGVLFPIFMSTVIILGVTSSIPEVARLRVKTEIALSMLMVIPLAVSYMSIGSATLLEFEKHIPERMRLFGFKYADIFISRLIIYSLFMLMSIVVYFTYCLTVLKVAHPSVTGVLVILLFLTIIAVSFTALAFGIANFIPKYGLGFGIIMASYFFFLFLGGMMGITVHNMPPVFRSISRFFPISYYQTDVIYNTWIGKSANLMPLIQASIFFLTLCVIILLLSFYFRKRRV